MLKRYIILTVALSFMALYIPRCPFDAKKSSAVPLLTQTPVVQPAVASL